MNLAFNDRERERNMSFFSLSLTPRSMISDSGTHDVNSVCFRSILISMSIWNNVNNFRSSVQCHGNGDGIVSVCTKLYSWLMFVQACLFVCTPSSLYTFSTILLPSFCREFMSRLCHGFASGNSRVIDGRSVQIRQSQFRNCWRPDVKGFTWLWRISRLFLISPMIGLVKASSHTCKFLRLSNSRIIYLRNL